MSVSGRAPVRFLAGIALFFGLVGVLALPSRADAWAWKDQCQANVYNGTPVNVRMIFWTPVPPVPSNIQLLPVYIAGGVNPGDFGMLTTNTGYPVSWGCHGTLSYLAPNGTVACSYSAPTSGDNSFSCTGGPRGLKWRWDDKDLWVTVGIPVTPPAGGEEVATPTDLPDITPARSETREALRARLTDDDLPGDWTATDDLVATGPIGAAWMAGTEADACGTKADSGDTPGHAGSLLRRGDGSFSASAVADFPTAAKANAVYDAALSRASAGCLADLIASGVAVAGGSAQTRVAALHRGDLGDESDGWRISIDAGAWTGTLDVLGTREGDQMTVLMLGSTAAAPGRRLETRALRRVAARMDGD